VWEGRISSFPSLSIIAIRLDEKYILGINKKNIPQVNNIKPL
jgi:hypothetical protein